MTYISPGTTPIAELSMNTGSYINMHNDNIDDRLYSEYLSSGQVDSVSATLAIQGKGGRARFLRRLIRKHFPQSKKEPIFDAACGHGALISAAKQAGYTNLRGVDLSKEQVTLANSLGLVEVCQGDALKELAKHKDFFALVALIDVLEHLDLGNAVDLTKAAHSSLAVGGCLLIHVPNADGIFGMRARYGDLTHKRAFNASSISQLLSHAGFGKIYVYEDKPNVHGPVSLVRRLVWAAMTSVWRISHVAETGVMPAALSQNITVIAKRVKTP